MPYQSFLAVRDAKWCAETIEVIPSYRKIDELPVMCICAQEGPIYITREQAMEFFDLRKPMIELINPLAKFFPPVEG